MALSYNDQAIYKAQLGCTTGNGKAEYTLGCQLIECSLAPCPITLSPSDVLPLVLPRKRRLTFLYRRY